MKKFISSGVEYQIVEFLGEGGCSEVYRAKRRLKEAGVDQELALKILKSETLVDIWRKEFQEFQNLKSPHLVNIFGFDKVDGRPALLMECIHGVSLSELRRYKNIPQSVAKEILRQIQQGLTDLHCLGKCHGDLSPNNILIDVNGRVVLTDFLGQQAGFGTIEFTAPEIMSGQLSNPATDQYSFAKIAEWLGAKNLSDHFDGNGMERLAKLIQEVRKVKETRSFLTEPLSSEAFKLQSPLQIKPLFLILPLVMFLVGSDASSVHRSDYPIEIITENWAEISINGKKLGYPPIYFVSSTPEVFIEWRNHKSSGNLHLTLRQGEYRRINDDALSLNQGEVHER